MHPKAMHPNVQAVQDALTAADAYGQVRMLPDAVATAAAAAEALAVFPTTYAELVRITAGTPAEVA